MVGCGRPETHVRAGPLHRSRTARRVHRPRGSDEPHRHGQRAVPHRPGGSDGLDRGTRRRSGVDDYLGPPRRRRARTPDRSSGRVSADPPPNRGWTRRSAPRPADSGTRRRRRGGLGAAAPARAGALDGLAIEGMAETILRNQGSGFGRPDVYPTDLMAHLHDAGSTSAPDRPMSSSSRWWAATSTPAGPAELRAGGEPDPDPAGRLRPGLAGPRRPADADDPPDGPALPDPSAGREPASRPRSRCPPTPARSTSPTTPPSACPPGRSTGYRGGPTRRAALRRGHPLPRETCRRTALTTPTMSRWNEPPTPDSTSWTWPCASGRGWSRGRVDAGRHPRRRTSRRHALPLVRRQAGPLDAVAAHGFASHVADVGRVAGGRRARGHHPAGVGDARAVGGREPPLVLHRLRRTPGRRVVFTLVAMPEDHRDPHLSTPRPRRRPADDPRRRGDGFRRPGGPARGTAQGDLDGLTQLTPHERALFGDWLDRVAT